MDRSRTQEYVNSLSNPGYMFRHAIQVCASGSVVYVRNLKSASTFFYWNLTKKFGWKEISWQDIDWRQQHVFGHLQDPIVRRHKGVAEFIMMNKAQNLFNESEQFKNFIKHTPVFDEHTCSYHATYGDSCYHIDWIPIANYSHEQVIKITETLLKHHGVFSNQRWDHSFAHYSDPEKKKIELQLKQIYESESTPDWLNWHLHNDRMLYNTVQEKFNHTAESWPLMSWLRAND